jgi:hypothetical protein
VHAAHRRFSIRHNFSIFFFVGRHGSVTQAFVNGSLS